MTINELQDEIIEEFSQFDDWMDKYALLIDLGNSLEVLDEKHKTPQNIIEGCQSRVWLNAIPPYQGGGEMIATVSFEKTTYNELPFKFEAGTPDYIGSTAFAEALRYLQEIGIDKIAAYEHELTAYATLRLGEIENMRIIGTAAEKSAVISFLVGEIHPYDIGMLLDKLGIAVRTGHHCAQPLIDSLGIPGTVRASFAFYNTKQEIDSFVDALKRVVAMLS